MPPSDTGANRGFPTDLHPIFVRLAPDDLPALMAIEHASFPTPWSEGTYRSELRNSTASYWVMRPGARRLPPDVPALLGYAGLWHLGDEAHVTTIAVHPDWRRRHLGEWLLIQLLGAAREHGADSVTLEVRVHNRPAIELYHKLGFKTVGVRRGYYRDTGEDARLLTLNGLQTPAQWEALQARLRQIEAGDAPHPSE